MAYVKNGWLHLDSGEELVYIGCPDGYGSYPGFRNNGDLVDGFGSTERRGNQLTDDQREEISAFMVQAWKRWAGQ